LLDNLIAYGNVLNEMKTFTSKGKPLNVVRLKKLEDKFHFPSVVLLRSDLQKVLLNAIPSQQIQFNKQCIKVETISNTTHVHFADGTVETGDAVIFADGVHSIARNDIFNLPPLKYANRTSWRGVAQFSELTFPDNACPEILGRGRRIGIFPLPGNMAYWYAAVNMSQEEAEKQEKTAQSVLSHFNGWAEPVNTLIKNTGEDRLILTRIFHAPDIPKLVSGHMALLGDAAHPMTPDLGQGACQAIEDAWILAECLSQDQSVIERLRTYENKRLQRVRSIARNSFRMGRLRQMDNPLGLAIRNNLFRILPESWALSMLEQNIKTTDKH
jgi:2-polyprenyl-6-methoxyphenol hydroxylase-like FAD-dependent oxidoreductase